MDLNKEYMEDRFSDFTLNLEQVKTAVEDCPFSALSRLLLLKQSPEQEDSYEQLEQLTALYVTNPVWMKYLLYTAQQQDKSEEYPGTQVNEIPVSSSVPEETDPEKKENTEKNDEDSNDDADASPVAQEEGISDQSHTPEDTDSTHDESEEKDIPFEPMHTIDYFASLGIQLTEQDLSNDRLGRQLKSFTGWLKSMKKIHPTELPGQDVEVEKLIRRAAEISNLDTKVLTEAMAEVLVKQNKKDKAVEMYEKLSLMDPSKSSYFAGKIEKLKTS